MKTLITIIALIFCISSLFGADESQISFSGGQSSIVLREGRENVVLSDGATVKVGSLEISAMEIVLSGNGWREVQCNGNATIVDDERGISIMTTNVYYDRNDERLLISSWYEIEDVVNAVSATGAFLEYSLDEERLRLDKSVMLLKDTDKGAMRCRAESVIFSRSANSLELRGDASVYWDGDEYGAEVIRVDLNTDSILLEGRIRGNING